MPLKLLCVFAHPDDECFAFGGAIALAAERGVEISAICLTAGQAGSYRGNAKSNEELATIRIAEFAASCDILGIQHHEVLDYQDGQLEFADFSKLAGELVQRIRAFQPNIILTFGGDGSHNSHPDHTVTSALTTAAFHWASHPRRYPEIGPLFQPERLYYVTTNYFLPERHVPAVSPWTVTLDVSSVFDRKQRAFAAHVTQSPLMIQTEPIFREHGQEEHYILAAATTPQPAHQTTSLFEGLTEQ
jgi:LmbE family N-acetylglucosaminyl deacetylase